jgi:hypothetical protein
MRTEMSRQFSVPLKQAYDYLMDPKRIPEWRVGVIEMIDPESAFWHAAGDHIKLAYRLLGRRVESECILDEVKEHELVRYTVHTPGLPVLHEAWHYSPMGEDALAVRVVQESEEASSFFGKAIDRMVLPRVLEKDLTHALDNLEDIFSVGVPD